MSVEFDEIRRLAVTTARSELGRRVREIIITHLHPDHIGGVMHLAEKFNLPIAANERIALDFYGSLWICIYNIICIIILQDMKSSKIFA